MTPDPALDAAIRQARHLLFAFDGPIRRTDDREITDPASPTTPYIHEALAACRESGRSAVVITHKPLIDVPAYLEAHDLFTQVAVIAASISDAVSTLEAPPTECLLITSSADDIKAAQAAGSPTIGYARTPQDAARLTEIGTTSFVYSMSDLALSLRTNRKGGNS
jgi:phosphoglycolate phosphatase